jgi:hypothetical protein
MDRDGDGYVSLGEKTVHFESVWRAETGRRQLVEFEPRYEARDWVAYHDAPRRREAEGGSPGTGSVGGGGGDGLVSLAEWQDGVVLAVMEFARAKQRGAIDKGSAGLGQ